MTLSSPHACRTLLITLWVVFAIQWILAPSGFSELSGFHSAYLAAIGGGNGLLIQKNGEWFRLLTAAFLHANFLHIIFNSIALWYIGRILEPLVGARWFLAIFFLSAIGGSYLSCIVNSPQIVFIGASGGVMGLVASLLGLLHVLQRTQARQALRSDLIRIIAISLIPWGSIDIYGHLGGAIIGGILGIILYGIWDESRHRLRLSALALVINGMCIFSLLGALPSLKADYTYFSTLAYQASQSVR